MNAAEKEKKKLLHEHGRIHDYTIHTVLWVS